MWLLVLTFLVPIHTTVIFPCENYRDCKQKQDRIVAGFQYAALTDASYAEGTYQLKVVWR